MDTVRKQIDGSELLKAREYTLSNFARPSATRELNQMIDKKLEQKKEFSSNPRKDG